ncbi:Hypothetical predicted protein [Octopus vulgaris]|uniref:Uncharacterized protein n=1 Tax=Octopus vulgaris TaxID=6645 RepID=A0AA36F2U6_OCTVU|nr:Hypothetical predicted protein [Octopus vulgaris]
MLRSPASMQQHTLGRNQVVSLYNHSKKDCGSSSVSASQMHLMSFSPHKVMATFENTFGTFALILATMWHFIYIKRLSLDCEPIIHIQLRYGLTLINVQR